ncbi:MAG TPA: DUF2335 domain-containing protein [Gammaproteobacteria bacterium]|nr:DUF2335 domain-containing protein [Gammaproteobacteria bacterium]
MTEEKTQQANISNTSESNHLEDSNTQEKEIDPIVEQFLEDNPKLGELVSQHPEIKRKLTIEAFSFSGPLPHPKILKEYNEVHEGFAERILVMAEKDADHIREMQAAALGAKKLEVTMGQIFAFIIGIVALLCGTYIAVNNHPVVGTLIGTGGVIGLVSAFILGRSNSKKSKSK